MASGRKSATKSLNPIGFITHPPERRKQWAAALLAGLVLFGCNPSPKPHHRTQLIMGTTVEITAVSRDPDLADSAMTAAFKEMQRIDRLLSTYIDSSEISRINRSAGSSPALVSDEVLSLVRVALELAEVTEGGFNIAIGPAVDLWKVSENPRIPSDDELETVRPLVDYRLIEIDEKNHTLFLPRAGMRIDLGGIGKGYAADRASEVLIENGITDGIVAVAGDLKVFGNRPDGKPFRIAIRHPRTRDAVLAAVSLTNEAVSTSGDYERFFMVEGRRYHHILDPKTLRPAAGVQSITVVAAEAERADALSTGIFVLGPEKGMALLERLPGTEGVIVDAEGGIMVSSGLQSRIELSP